ncbi:unnamed protein product [Brassica oleracea]|uniref:(rape) hypothetical protein n=1 Tax=Brassica napus TaxID=3708 RepID=A0A816Q640_BRANA|nr:unnamed protein product [Brassica napus]
MRNVPYLLFNTESLSRLATAVGRPVCVAPKTQRKENFKVAKLYVKVDLTSRLPDTIVSGFSNGREVLIDVSYPWLPLKCDNCGKYGHKKEDCKVGAATTNHEGPPPKKNVQESSRRRSKSRPSRSRAVKSQEDDTNIVALGQVTSQDVQCEAEVASLASHASSDNDKIVDSKVEPESDGSLVAGEGGDDGLVTSETVAAGTIPCATEESSKSSHGVTGDVTIEPSEATMVEPAVCNVAENQEEEGEVIERAENIELGQSISLGSVQAEGTGHSEEAEKPFFLVNNRKCDRKVTKA